MQRTKTINKLPIVLLLNPRYLPSEINYDAALRLKYLKRKRDASSLETVFKNKPYELHN